MVGDRRGRRGEAAAGPDAMKRILLALLGLFIVYQVAGRTWDAIAFRYFRHQCKAHGGEFIYRTVDNVEGVFQMRLRDPRDYFDRLRKGDIPEDPYGHTNWEAQEPQYMFVSPPERPYAYLENPIQDWKSSDSGARIRHYYRDAPNQRPMPFRELSEPKSEFGFTWREERSFWDKVFGVRQGVLDVVSIKTGEILATRKGYFIETPFKSDLDICPRGKDDDFTYEFVAKVLKPKR